LSQRCHLTPALVFWTQRCHLTLALVFWTQHCHLILALVSSLLSNIYYININNILLDKEFSKINLEQEIHPNIKISSMDNAYMMYTSGSTGIPKGVMIPHQGVVRLVKDTNYIQIDEGQTVAFCAPTSFDASTFEIWGALLNGARLVICPPGKITPESVGSLVQKYNVTILYLTSGLFNLMVEERINDLQNLRYLISGGDVMSPHSAKKAVKTLQNTCLLNGYGPTENTVFTTVFEVPYNWDFDKSIPIGRAINGTNVYIMDKELSVVRDGQIGELVVDGLGVAKGYWNQADLTKEKFITINNRILYKTGDLGRKLPNGNIEYLGRIDSQVKIRGFRIELGEIENVILKDSNVKTCSTVVREDIPGGKRVVAYIVPIEHSNFGVAKLKEFLKQKLPEYMLPSNYVIMESLPLDSNGKVDKNALPTTIFDRYDLGITYQAPRTKNEKKLANVWRKLLHIKEVGTNDDFFDMGGNSILAAQATIRMQEILKINLPMGILYERPTISKLCQFINQTVDEKNTQTLDLASEIQLDKEITPLTEFQPGMYKQDKIFLTGSTGFLGAFLIKELVEYNPHVEIYCLVRSANNKEGLHRIKQNMEKYAIWNEAYLANIFPVVGYLDKPLLGLSSNSFYQLANKIDVIYHTGAKVNYVQTYDLHKNANVIGTKTILKLACTSNIKPVHHLSTISVFGPIGYFTDIKVLKEDSNLDMAEYPLYNDMGYAQSKWVAEKIMWEAKERGFPITVLRPGFIMGDSITGVNNTEDYVARLIKGCIQLGTYGDLPKQRKEFIPVDFITKAIRKICSNPFNFGKAYHLVPPYQQSVDLVDFFEKINDQFGYNIKKIPYKEWVNQLILSSKNNSDNALIPFLPLLSEKIYKDKTVWELYENMPTCDSSNTQQALIESKLTCPKMDNTLLGTYFNYMIEIGFIPSPSLINKHVMF